jgi:hypothetical protein
MDRYRGHRIWELQAPRQPVMTRETHLLVEKSRLAFVNGRAVRQVIKEIWISW